MQNAEEVGGPEGNEYLKLMRAIAEEANTRLDVYSRTLAERWSQEACRAVDVGIHR